MKGQKISEKMYTRGGKFQWTLAFMSRFQNLQIFRDILFIDNQLKRSIFSTVLTSNQKRNDKKNSEKI